MNREALEYIEAKWQRDKTARIFLCKPLFYLAGWQDSNPATIGFETAVLPIELTPLLTGIMLC